MHGGLIPMIGASAENAISQEQPAPAAPVQAAALSQTARPNQPRKRRMGEIFCYKSNVAGKVYSNTLMFDDYKSVVEGSMTAYLYELRIMHDSDFIYGIQAFHQVDGKIAPGPAHYGKEVHTGCRNDSLKLQYGECIIAISGNYQDVVNGLMITTSLGKTYAFGNYTTRCDTSR